MQTWNNVEQNRNIAKHYETFSFDYYIPPPILTS